LGYEEPHLKQRLDVIMQMDRGYNIASVTRLLLKLRCQLLGTHSEKVGKWPYCTSGTPREWQQPVPVDGASTALFSKRKVNNVECLALCYRNGNKGIGMIHTTLPLPGIWDLITNGSLTDSPAIAFKTSTAELLYFRWLSSIIMFVAYQGSSPWFEARVGHLTGTTALKIIKTLKFVLLEDTTLPSAVTKLMQVLGLALERKTTEKHINPLDTKQLRRQARKQ
jgi:hypothetical protein